jgi:hypothetical protein
MHGRSWNDSELATVRKIARAGGSFDDAAKALGNGETRTTVRLKSRKHQIIFTFKGRAHHGTSSLCLSKPR